MKLLAILKALAAKVRAFTLTGKQKAAAAAVYSAVVTYVAQTHMTWQGLTHWAAVWALLGGVGGHLVTYWFTNSGQAE